MEKKIKLLSCELSFPWLEQREKSQNKIYLVCFDLKQQKNHQMPLQNGTPCTELDAHGISAKTLCLMLPHTLHLMLYHFFPHVEEIQAWQPTELSHFCISSRGCL